MPELGCLEVVWLEEYTSLARTLPFLWSVWIRFMRLEFSGASHALSWKLWCYNNDS